MNSDKGHPPNPIMTVAEVSDFLQVHPSTLYRLIRQGKIPVFKIGNDYRFSREQIYNWIAEKQRTEDRRK